MRVGVLTEQGALSREYTYELPPELEDAGVGACVLVPFQAQVRLGYIIERIETADVPRIRSVLGRSPSGDVLPERVMLAEWMARRWYTSISSSLRMMIPPAFRGKVVRRLTAVGECPGPSDKLDGQIWEALQRDGPLTLNILYKRFGKLEASRVISRLRKACLIKDEFDLSQPGKPKLQTVYEVNKEADAQAWLCANERRKPRQAALLRSLLEFRGPVTTSELAEDTSGVSAALSLLQAAGMVVSRQRETRREAREEAARVRKRILTADQQAALDRIAGCLDTGGFQETLIFGVTASGKTEVYLRAIHEALTRGRAALVLMPEIALTIHAVAQFRAWFGDRLAVLHSRLSTGERSDEWRKIQNREADVVLGPRSAVFAPLKNLGLIIMDEEHEPAFKQDSDPRYHARDLCRWLAEREGIPFVLGSATPSVETYYRAKQSGAHLCVIPARVDDRPMPDVQVVDMREYARFGKLTILSDPLRDQLRSITEDGGQAILFLNRRAYGTFVLCRECGYVTCCPNCAVSAKFHSVDHTIRCHHCNWHGPSPLKCPSCNGVKIASFGVGTQRVEEELKSVIPGARLLRMDRDTTTRKDSLVSLIEKFRRREADVLVGTQMVAKGLDFPGVLLVGVINADTGLNMPDFRAAERAFQLLTQVAGRAGRGVQPGRVVLQTFQPEHYAVQASAHHDFERFYRDELQGRQDLGWPPFGFLARVLFQDPNEQSCRRLAEKTAEVLQLAADDVEILGPSSAPIERLKGRFRWHLLLRAKKREDILRFLDQTGARKWPSNVTIDIDPMTLM